MFRNAFCLAATLLLAAALPAAPPSSDGSKVWELEDAYWHYVQANDLRDYRALWSPDFLGWPSVSPEPVRKDHITDWITNHTERHEVLRSYELERLAINVSGNLATTTYRIHMSWQDPDGAVDSSVSRLIHTWVRNAAGEWQIVSGMSSPADASGH